MNDNVKDSKTVKESLKTAEKILRYCLIAILFFWGAMLLFVFIINWEGWIFGIRIAGLYAGIYLLVRGLIALLLGCSLVYHPKRRTISGSLSLILFSYMLLDSEYTGQVLHPGNTSVPEIFILFASISLFYLITRIGLEDSKKDIIKQSQVI